MVDINIFCSVLVAVAPFILQDLLSTIVIPDAQVPLIFPILSLVFSGPHSPPGFFKILQVPHGVYGAKENSNREAPRIYILSTWCLCRFSRRSAIE